MVVTIVMVCACARVHRQELKGSLLVLPIVVVLAAFFFGIEVSVEDRWMDGGIDGCMVRWIDR